MKKALLIGINYTGTPQELFGCVNDIKNTRAHLLESGYLPENIKVLTDVAVSEVETEESSEVSEVETKLPTRQNILMALMALISSGADCLYVHYSGHGGQTLDLDGDEDDGRDETIYPSDFKSAGVIVDDELRALTVHLQDHQKMFCVFDSCHSGTVMDLRYKLVKEYGTGLKMMADPRYQPTRGQCVLLSGCMDNQTSVDAFESGQPQGALTAAFLQVVKSVPKTELTYEVLITKVRQILKEKQYSQFPVLSSGKDLVLSRRVVY